MLSWLLATSQTKIQGLQARELPAGHLPFFSIWELHVWQRLYGCELTEDGSERGYDHYAYDGKDFLSFNKATLNWTAVSAEAEMTKKKWDAELNRGWRKKIYLEGECFAWLKKCLEYGTEARARKRAEPPVVTIRSKTQADGMEILLCQAHGFYPREIDASWRRDGEVWLEDTLQESVAPNSDGTYHYQLSVRIDPKERGRYRCHVEHDGLQKPLDVAMEEAEIPNEENLIFILYSTIPVLGILILGITGILCYKKCPRRDYRAAAKSDPNSSMDNAEKSPLKETEGIPPLNNTAGEESKGDCPPSQGIGEKKQPPENHQISV